jgi:hypothetical protein
VLKNVTRAMVASRSHPRLGLSPQILCHANKVAKDTKETTKAIIDLAGGSAENMAKKPPS